MVTTGIGAPTGAIQEVSKEVMEKVPRAGPKGVTLQANGSVQAKAQRPKKKKKISLGDSIEGKRVRDVIPAITFLRCVRRWVLEAEGEGQITGTSHGYKDLPLLLLVGSQDRVCLVLH